MSELQYFKILEDHGEYRPVGRVSLDQMTQLVASALTFAREQHVKNLLVVTSDLIGFEPPLLPERYFFVKTWARAAGRTVRAAFVALPKMIDEQKFGVTVAENNGFAADIFPTEEEALAWLHQRPAKKP
ncbi:MAG: hypothetical protein ACREKL_00530 [Chthoniobacterales bacterium]